MNFHRALVGAIAVLAAGCGARGAPMAPLRTVPPPLPAVEVSQLGTRALLRFFPIADTIDMGNDNEITIDRVEILMLTERYPALTASILAQGLDRERVRRLELARQAVELAAEDAEARRVAQERIDAEAAAAAAAGIELPPEIEDDPEEELPVEEEEDLITEEQRLLDLLPRNALREWREAGVEGVILVEAARWFEAAVDELWDLLAMPTAIVDTRRPPDLPRPSLVVEKAAQLARTHPYEGTLEPADFAHRAIVVAEIPFENINDYVSGGRARIDYNVGTSSSGPVRTRYYFGARVVDTQGNLGRIDVVAPLAPGGVPLAPLDLEVEITLSGAQLRWSAPPGDVWGDFIDADQIGYNIYRRVVDSEIVSATPINYTPITETSYLDYAMPWGDRYIYEVRAVAAPPSSEDTPLLVEPEPPQLIMVDPANPTLLVEPTEPTGPIKESRGALTPPTHVVDTFKPDKLVGLEAVRASTRVTLRWTESYATDLVGYRIYRRPLIEDPCDPDYMSDGTEPVEVDEDEKDGEEGEDEEDGGCRDGQTVADDEDELTVAEDGDEDEDGDGDGLLGALDENDGENDAEDEDAETSDSGDAANGGEPTDGLPGDDEGTAAVGGGDAADLREPDPQAINVDRLGGLSNEAEDGGDTNDGVPSEGDSDDDDPDEDTTGTDDEELESGDAGETSPDADDDSERDDSDAGSNPDSDESEVNGDPSEDAEESGSRRGRRTNDLVAAGWEMLTAVVISELRYTDPTASDEMSWEYVVEAVDDTGNVSEPAVVKLPLEDEEAEQ